MKQFVVFKLADEEFAVDISGVQGIEKPDKIVRVPESPKHIEGIMNLRGQVIPIFNLRRKFKFIEKSIDDHTKFIVVHIKDMLIAFIVDEVLEIIRMDADQIQDTPALLTSMERRYIQGVGQYNDRMIILLDLDLCISEEETEKIARLVSNNI